MLDNLAPPSCLYELRPVEPFLYHALPRGLEDVRRSVRFERGRDHHATTLESFKGMRPAAG